MCALGVREGVCVNGCEKEDHFIHCQQVVSESNLYTVGKLFVSESNLYTVGKLFVSESNLYTVSKLFLRVTYTLSASCF